jgi:alpha-glucosidase
LSIPVTLNLALSGVPFNAPDVPGFAGDADEDLLIRWYKAAFLFPFFRNHSCTGTRQQEPWAFTKRALEVTRNYVRLRYKLLPYLYSLFIEQERSGEAILRPLFYEFGSSKAQPLFDIEDQFMVGPAIMQAPLLSRHTKRRSVWLPPGHWYEAHTGRWRRGGASVIAREHTSSTPLYVREGVLLPMLSGIPHNSDKAMNDIEVHVYLRASPGQQAQLAYELDDGVSFDYKLGRVSRFSFQARVSGSKLYVNVAALELALGELRARLILYANFRRVVVLSQGVETVYVPRPKRVRFAGASLQVWQTEAFSVGGRP